MKFVDNWNDVREKISKHGWANSLFNRMGEYACNWIENYNDDPARKSGWGHNYFCGRCGTKLVFNAHRGYNHTCASCGFQNKGDRYDEAWNYFYRDETHKQAFYAAALYKITGKQEYLDFVRKVLCFYSDNYNQLQINVQRGAEGKIAGTDLCDAVGVIWLINAMEILKEDLSSAEKEYYRANLFFREVEVLNKHRFNIANIPCWIKTAIGMTGIYFNDKNLIKSAFEGPNGILDQLKRGVTEDGFWFEGSMHYHFYCLESLTYLLYFSIIYGTGYADAMKDIVKRMYIMPVLLEFDRGVLPNPNDGWPALRFSFYSGQYEFAGRMFDDDLIEYALSVSYGSYYARSPIIGGMCEATPDGWIQRLLFGKDRKGVKRPEPLSYNFADTNFCALKNYNAGVFLKYGFNTPLHSHPDIMNIELCILGETVSYDLSTNGYSSFLCPEWQKRTVSHSTVVIDMADQVSFEKGMTEFFIQEENAIKVRTDDVYPGVDYTREIRLENRIISDCFEVFAGEVHTVDWVFHCSGDIEAAYPMVNVEALGSTNGYEHMKYVRMFSSDNDWSISWVMADKKLTLKMGGCPGTAVYIFKGYEDVTEHLRYGVLVRRKTDRTVFKASYIF